MQPDHISESTRTRKRRKRRRRVRRGCYKAINGRVWHCVQEVPNPQPQNMCSGTTTVEHQHHRLFLLVLCQSHVTRRQVITGRKHAFDLQGTTVHTAAA